MDNPYLEITAGAGRMEFPLDQPQVTIGRHSSNALVISDGMASRSHCVIEKVGETFCLRDLEKTNGEKTNGTARAVPFCDSQTRCSE